MPPPVEVNSVSFEDGPKSYSSQLQEIRIETHRPVAPGHIEVLDLADPHSV